MSKEMMIVFVYDTEYCKNEADDPVKAVLYFHPSWVSDIQKISLCGQLMGTTHFLVNTFSARPKIISLQSGKFILKEFGRFILAVGTDRNLNNSILEHRAELLTSLVQFFHRDIQTMYDQFNLNTNSTTTTQNNNNINSNNNNNNNSNYNNGQTYKSLSDKLYHIFETYLPILQYNGNIFQNMPISRLPKSASNIFLDSMQTLQCCQQTKGVLGGCIFFNNKVIATQLSPELTKYLVLTDPYRIKSTAESIPVTFHIPVGVQLITVFISSKEYRKLSIDSERAQSVINQTTATSAVSAIIPFQFKKKMKRDKSIIFTNIPEECAIVECDETMDLSKSPSAIVCESATEAITATTSISSTTTSSSSLIGNKIPIAPRPNHLPLRFKNITSKDLPESGFSSINFDESDSFPQFIGRTSVCSTPMTEMKVLHGAVLSICANVDGENNDSGGGDDDIGSKSETSKQPLSNKSNFFTKTSSNILSRNYILNPLKGETRRHSLTSLQDSIKKIRLAMRPFGHGLAKFSGGGAGGIVDGGKFGGNSTTHKFPIEKSSNDNQNYYDYNYNDDDDNDVDDDNKAYKKRVYHTIADPMYPVFDSSGEPISRNLFEEFLRRQQEQEIDDGGDNNNGNDDEDEIDDGLLIDGFDSDMKLIMTPGQSPTISPPPPPISEKKTIPNRISLSLPLKSLTTSSSSTSEPIKDNINTTNIFDAPAIHRKKMSGIQLTPLMTKLSILALNDERSSSFSSWGDATPIATVGGGVIGGGIDLPTPTGGGGGGGFVGDKPIRRKSSIKLDDINELNSTLAPSMQKCELFVCGQQNMTMMLLLDETAAQKHSLVQAMFDICVSRLIRIETNLSQTLNVNVDGEKHDGGYSFLSLDPNWDTLQRTGPWSVDELNTLECMRYDFQTKNSITDMILRTDESVVYGYQHGNSSIFYKQAGQMKQGLPPPADAMGTIPINAKRRLERDHSIILL